MGEPRQITEVGTFGRYLRQVREQRKLSLDAVEEMTVRYPGRVTKSHLSRIENGRAEPTFPRMFALSQIYGVPIATLAERFESDLRRSLAPGGLATLTRDELLSAAERQRQAGRHAEALLAYDALIDRGASAVRVRLGRISCLVGLERFHTAKDECEDLLTRDDLEPGQRVAATHQFAQCCYRLGKYAFALMAVEQAEQLLGRLPTDDPKHVHLLTVKGNLFFVTGRFEQAAETFGEAVARYEAAGLHRAACRHRLNQAHAWAESGSTVRARTQMQQVLREARAGGYERLEANVLNGLGVLAHEDDDPVSAESWLLQSNSLARKNDYRSILFSNCYYLWKLAFLRKDGPAITANERTLRAYVGRVPENLEEAREFRAWLGGGA